MNWAHLLYKIFIWSTIISIAFYILVSVTRLENSKFMWALTKIAFVVMLFAGMGAVVLVAQ